MPHDEITIRKVRNKRNIENSTFLESYRKLLIDSDSLTLNEKFYLLSTALLFLNSNDPNVARLGYGIILRYSNRFREYKPLYDVALSKDYIPITKFIEDKYFPDETISRFSTLLLSAYQENFKVDDDSSNIYRSKGQMMLNKFALQQENIVVVAPTSYGKSELLIRKVGQNLTKKICIIVPSKALLAQMKTDLLKVQKIKEGFQKIITHPDMFRGNETSFLAVLTQERLLRLLQRNKDLSLDLVLVDEAHNLLEDGDRSHLLAQVLLILKKRKPEFLINLFTPFLADPKNINITNYNVDIKESPVRENIKVERFYTFDLNKKETAIYDQFLDRSFFIRNNDYNNDLDFINAYKSRKNIVYLNRPSQAEDVAIKLALESSFIDITPEIQNIIDSIADLIHPSYNLIECIKKGVVYHHGGIPDVIRLYIEDIYSKHTALKFIVSTSTLLEGVNIPGEKIFLLTPSKGRGYLSAAQFKNLIGRICRFREIFDKDAGDLRMLEPEVYLMKGKYTSSRFSLQGFLNAKVNANIVIEDEVENPLLEHSTNKDKAKEKLEYLENMEPGSSGLQNVTQPASEIGRLCFENSVHDFSIIENEMRLVSNLEAYKQSEDGKIKDPSALMEAIAQIFFRGVSLKEESGAIVRVQTNATARDFYKIFISWRIKSAPYPMMIKSFLGYWADLVRQGETLIYVGQKWGEETRDGHQALWVNIARKTQVEQINLAIAKIKEEQEFIDFYILKYVEILMSLNLIESDFYDKVKFGTSNKQIICLLKNGFSLELAKVLTSGDYAALINFNLEQDTFHYSQNLLDLMKENEENDILIFEARTSMP